MRIFTLIGNKESVLICNIWITIEWMQILSRLLKINMQQSLRKIKVTICHDSFVAIYTTAPILLSDIKLSIKDNFRYVLSIV